MRLQYKNPEASGCCRAKSMPRRTALASYFYDTSAPTGKVAQPMMGKWVHAKRGYWRWEGVGPADTPEPERRLRPKSNKPKKPNMQKSEKNMQKIEVQTLVTDMKHHFAEAEKILLENKGWALHDTIIEIDKMIRLCKDNVKDARLGKTTHTDKVEAVHSSTIDTTGWKMEDIHEKIANKCQEKGATNHLQTAHPYNSDANRGPYVNVVLQWLFVAKRQAMRVVELSVIGKKSAEERSFYEHSEKGKKLRERLHEINTSKPKKEHKVQLNLADKGDLEHQYTKLHP